MLQTVATMRSDYVTYDLDLILTFKHYIVFRGGYKIIAVI